MGSCPKPKLSVCLVFATFPEVFASMTKFDFRNRCNGRNNCPTSSRSKSQKSHEYHCLGQFSTRNRLVTSIFAQTSISRRVGRNLTYAWPRLPFGILVDRTLYAARHTRILDPGTSRVRELYAARPPVYLTVSDLQMNLRCLRCSTSSA